jgi:hypothetical protein
MEEPEDSAAHHRLLGPPGGGAGLVPHQVAECI